MIPESDESVYFPARISPSATHKIVVNGKIIRTTKGQKHGAGAGTVRPHNNPERSYFPPPIPNSQIPIAPRGWSCITFCLISDAVYICTTNDDTPASDSKDICTRLEQILEKFPRES